MRKFPVEDSGDSRAVVKEISRPSVALHERGRTSDFGVIRPKPSKTGSQEWLGLIDVIKARFPKRDLIKNVFVNGFCWQERGQVQGRDIYVMECSQDRNKTVNDFLLDGRLKSGVAGNTLRTLHDGGRVSGVESDDAWHRYGSWPKRSVDLTFAAQGVVLVDRRFTSVRTKEVLLVTSISSGEREVKRLVTPTAWSTPELDDLFSCCLCDPLFVTHDQPPAGGRFWRRSAIERLGQTSWSSPQPMPPAISHSRRALMVMW